MSRLDELIAELCPEGVSYTELGSVSHYAQDRIEASTIDKTTYVGVETCFKIKWGKHQPVLYPPQAI